MEISEYYPKQTLTPRRFHYRGTGKYDKKLLDVVVNTVIRYCNAQMIGELYTWFGVNNALLQDKLDSQREKREKAEKEVRSSIARIYAAEIRHHQERIGIEKKAQEDAKLAEDVLDEYKAELDDCKEQIDRLNNEIAKLQTENYGLRNKLSSNDSEPILYAGDQEQDIYPGEVKDLVISTLEKHLKYVNNDSRRYDVITDVINSNNYQATTDKRAKKSPQAG